MSGPQMIYFAGRALSVDLPSEERDPDTDARHVLALSSAIVQVAATAATVDTEFEDAQLRGLLVAVELMGSLCVVLSDNLATAAQATRPEVKR